MNRQRDPKALFFPCIWHFYAFIRDCTELTRDKGERCNKVLCRTPIVDVVVYGKLLKPSATGVPQILKQDFPGAFC